MKRRQAFTGALVVAAHLVVLLILGSPRPTIKPHEAVDTLPPIELSLVRIKPPAPAASAPAAGPAKPPGAVSSRPSPPAPMGVVAAPTQPAPQSSSALAAGPADCEVEDLPLLTEAERALCRNQIEVDRGRRLARAADARQAKQVAEAKAAPRIDSIPAEKRAYYDAVAAAYFQQSHGPPMAGRNPGLACGFPGVKFKKPPHSLKLGPLPCAITPPQGFLTEESGLEPP